MNAIATVEQNLILSVRRVSRDGGAYIAKCPHCKRILALEGDDMSEMRGEQYQDRACGGWMEVTHGAVFVRELPGEQP